MSTATEELTKVRKEVASALNSFTEEGFAEEISFYAGPSGGPVLAARYGPNGEVIAQYKITFTVEEVSA